MPTTGLRRPLRHRRDWYDAVLLPDGRMTLVVGDVAGHGLEAAITMGQMRSAARALAPDYGPAALLEALDRFLCRTVDEPLATAAAVVIDPAKETLDAGIARLAVALKAALPANPARLCDALVEQSVPHNDRDDDIAILNAYLA